MNDEKRIKEAITAMRAVWFDDGWAHEINLDPGPAREILNAALPIITAAVRAQVAEEIATAIEGSRVDRTIHGPMIRRDAAAWIARQCAVKPSEDAVSGTDGPSEGTERGEAS